MLPLGVQILHCKRTEASSGRRPQWHEPGCFGRDLSCIWHALLLLLFLLIALATGVMLPSGYPNKLRGALALELFQHRTCLLSDCSAFSASVYLPSFMQQSAIMYLLCGEEHPAGNRFLWPLSGHVNWS